MKKILIFLLVLGTSYSFAQPLTSTPAGCAITNGGRYRVYQIVTASNNGLPTYEGSTLGVRYSDWTFSNGNGIDKTRLPCLTLNTGSSNSCYVKLIGPTFVLGTSTTFTVNSGSIYQENTLDANLFLGRCVTVPVDDYAWILLSVAGCSGFLFIRRIIL
ncbi:hypothetical protein [Pedobacter aquatilis]|uniref:hypothetical protein n=1 Tax=Pedobacter aquatilis TaxID=351343 RepID=UPI00292DBFC9|nr:hypothetical protein [Pedobacter aquatilis]